MVVVVVMMLGSAACGDGGETVDTDGGATTSSANSAPTTEPGGAAADASPAGAGCAVVVDVVAEATGENQYTFSVTVRSADTGWDKYADAWVVRDSGGTVLGERVLAHPHVEEQPFTRSLSGVVVPAEVGEVEVAARDSVAGFCGATMRVELPGRS
jgi:hypothetical protein